MTATQGSPVGAPRRLSASNRDRVDGRFVAGERNGRGVRGCRTERARLIEDPEEPGLERGPTLESIDAADHSHPGVLDRLLGHGMTRYVGARQSTVSDRLYRPTRVTNASSSPASEAGRGAPSSVSMRRKRVDPRSHANGAVAVDTPE